VSEANLLAVIGSSNIGKIEGCRRALSVMAGAVKIEVVGVDVQSGVSGVPVGELECLRGAANRADACQLRSPHAHYWIGVESGLRLMPASTYAMTTYAFIRDGDGRIGFGSSSSHPVLQAVETDLVQAGGSDLLARFPSGNQSIAQLTSGAYTLEHKVYEAVLCAHVALGLCADPRGEH
jgi:non-canonical (house-cleaning) NTP pyrophosphatase